MKKSNIVIISIVAFVAIVLIWGISTNNRLVTKDEAVKSAWSKVENAYKRRADLVKQLTKVVEGAANYEKGVLTEVTNARAGIEQVKVDPENPSAEQLKALEQADKKFMKALDNTIKITVERYPELTATQNFRDFQTQIESSENRISTARDRFIEANKEYNTQIRRFPSSIIASMFGFEPREYFDAPKEAEEPADIEFNI